MGKQTYTIEQAAKLLSNETHAIYWDKGGMSVIMDVLKKAFPNDKSNNNYVFDEENEYYGFCRNQKGNWADTGVYLEHLEIINLSDIIKDVEFSPETFTISKDEYELFMSLKKAENKLRDKFATDALCALVSNNRYFTCNQKDMIVESEIFKRAYSMADEMIKQRKK